jgi:branched-chain amino acid transport system substrate-binding protein
VTIGVALPFTGAAAAYGTDLKQGVELALEEINAAGGVLGKPLKIAYEDDQATPEGGVSAVRKLMQQDKVDAVSGGTNSSVVLAEVPQTKNKILQVNMGAQSDAITADGGDLLFQINAITSQYSANFNDWIVKGLKPKTVAYMGENTAFNAGVLDLLKKDMAAAGITMLPPAEYEADTRDFLPILSRFAADKADLLVVTDGLASRGAVLFKQARQLGFQNIVAGQGTLTPSYVQAAGPAMNGVYTGDIYDPAIDNPTNKAFIAAFQKKYGAIPQKAQDVAYEGIKVIADAMNKAQSKDSAKVAAVMRSTQFTVPRGSLGFGDHGRPVIENFFIQQVKDGQITLDKPWTAGK